MASSLETHLVTFRMAIWDYWRLSRQLQSVDADERLQVVKQLAKDEDPRAVKLLLAATNDEHKAVRYEAILILSSRQLKSKKSEKRNLAAQALGQVPRERAAKLLWKFRDQISGEVLERALARVGDAAVGLLSRKLNGDEPQLRCMAARVLGNIDGESARTLLIEAMGDQNNFRFGCMQAIVIALQRLGFKPRSLEEKVLFALERGQVRQVGRIGAPVVPLLTKVIQEARYSKWVKYGRFERTAVFALAEMPAEVCRSAILTVVGSRTEFRGSIDVDLAFCRARHGDEKARAELHEHAAKILYDHCVPAAGHLVMLGEIAPILSLATIPRLREAHDQLVSLLKQNFDRLSMEILQTFSQMNDWPYKEVVDETPPNRMYAGVGMDFPGEDWDRVYERTWDCSAIRMAASAALAARGG